MFSLECMPNRRDFLKGGVGMAVGLSARPRALVGGWVIALGGGARVEWGFASQLKLTI